MRDEALYVTVSDSYNTVIREHTTEAEIVTLDAFLGRERQGLVLTQLPSNPSYTDLILTSYDLLFIPDCNDNELDLAARVRDVVCSCPTSLLPWPSSLDQCQVVGGYVIAIGTGRLRESSRHSLRIEHSPCRTVLARSGLLKDTLASSVSLELVGNHIRERNTTSMRIC